MTVLSHQSIRKLCGTHGMVRRRDNLPLSIEPVSIDLHLDEILLDDNNVVKNGILEPGVFCLGSAIETFKMPDHVVGLIIGKSTWAREGLQIEAAGLVDPGFIGDITFELKNLHHKDPISLLHSESIGQVYFMHLDEPVETLYGPDNGNHYHGQRGVTRSYRQTRMF